MTKLVPKAPLVKASESPATLMAQLTLHRRVETGDFTTWSFLKQGKGSLRDKETPRQFATITIWRNKPHQFTLSWYPWQDQAQIVEELPISRLAAATQDLADAGFAPPAPLPPHPLPPKLPELTDSPPQLGLTSGPDPLTLTP